MKRPENTNTNTENRIWRLDECAAHTSDDMKSTHNEAGLSPGKKSDRAPVHKQVRPDGTFDELAAKYGG